MRPAPACRRPGDGRAADRPAAPPAAPRRLRRDPTTTAAPSVSSGPAGSGIGRYVALGDSYSAGPLIPTTDLAGGCARSDHNYPSLVAKRLDVGTLRRRHLQRRDHPRPGPRAGGRSATPGSRRSSRAVTRGTDLVTLGIGGNDLDLFGTLVGTCTRLRASDPHRARRAPGGSPRAARTCDAATRTISAERRRRAAGDPRAAPRRRPWCWSATCGWSPTTAPARKLPLAAGDYAEGRRISQVLDRALQQAARRPGSAFVDMYAASRGHDICSADPWVNGGVTDRQRALAYHPFASGMRADAARVVAAVGRG